MKEEFKYWRQNRSEEKKSIVVKFVDDQLIITASIYLNSCLTMRLRFVHHPVQPVRSILQPTNVLFKSR